MKMFALIIDRIVSRKILDFFKAKVYKIDRTVTALVGGSFHEMEFVASQLRRQLFFISLYQGNYTDDHENKSE